MTGPADAVVTRIDAALSDFLARRLESLARVGPELAPVGEQARSFVLDGGKRMRPLFAFWGWRSVQPASADDTALITAAASLELLHACALVHDDVMDDSDTRRGRPATHAAFAALHRSEGWTGDAHTFGAAAAILLGDLLLSWSDTMFAGAGLNGASAAEARRVFDDMRELVMAGQYLDVLVQARGGFDVAEALKVVRFKTSKYTVEGPLRLGAAAACAPPETVTALSEYGLALGEAFQLRDDVLGVFGDPATTGKPAGDDLREGKRTLLVALAMEAATPAQAARLRARLGDRGIDDGGIDELRAIVESTGALHRVEQRIATRAGEAHAALQTPAVSDDARAALESLVVAASVRVT